ncbi:MAG: hypothetical protein LBL50_02885 [Candidatus Margulisbacteria bacterium]|jgi:hypothetical protein|nr:hypothetical protein [Candidatus Margulisiibacteriota bacterium]
MTIAKGQSMLASDILNLTFFPKGAILIFNGADYLSLDQNIWKICDGKNGTPNLINKFLRGSTDSGATDGADSRNVTLTTAHLPSHSHAATGLSLSGLSLSGLKATSNGAHEHVLTGKVSSAGSHGHGITDPGHTHTTSSEDNAGGFGTYEIGGGAGTVSYLSTNKTGITINSDGAHEHSFSSDSKAFSNGAHEHDVTGSISGGSVSGSTANTGSGTAFTVDTLPSYYAVIYIMKIV